MVDETAPAAAGTETPASDAFTAPAADSTNTTAAATGDKAAAGSDDKSEAGDAFAAPADEGDGKGDEGKPEEGKTEAPEAYADFTLPEGAQIDAGLMTEFQAECKALGLSQEAAQGQLDRMLGWKTKVDQLAAKAWGEKASGWQKQSKEAGLYDPAIISKANAGMKAAGADREFTTLLGQLGLSHHPVMIKLAENYGKATSNDTTIPGSASAGGSKPSREQIMFGGSSPTPS